ncbi:ABC-type antimicrobial peptide transport system permease subunit [Larkinella arboricola]|uniref:ABC-type antimicrobial peptide transport system permease subunit n=1 Tax=Larkinella arboricola TaxID=643671 RepID=A0A327X6B8_LARAB|nr:ABC transporter permease [Larkinella arboricola]RAK02271.1 ABC-type antimicrobial peptide transport system permease subunit [Larkinella arboricola]
MTPPRFADRLLNWLVAPHLREEVLGDMHERFQMQANRLGASQARRRYWRDLLAYLRPAFIRRKPTVRRFGEFPNPTNTAMIRNHFKIAFRNLIGGKSFSAINISGLAVGMAGAVLISLWLYNEISFDRFHAHKDRLFQVYGLTGDISGERIAISTTSQPLGPALEKDYPEVEAITRVREIDKFLIRVNEKSFSGIEGAFVDAAFLNMFSFPLVEGTTHQQLTTVSSIVITEKLAKKLFGDAPALGKSIQLDSVDHFVVTGVLKDLPPNTRFSFEYLLPWAYLKKLGTGWSNDDWLSNNTPTYVLLKPNTDPAVFGGKIKDMTWRYAGRKDVWTHFLHPLSQWHLYSEFENGKPVGGRIETVRVFGLIAAFILLIACINFMNLSTARSEKRAKEIGIRKVAGAGRGLLISQFMAEAVLTTCLAGAVAMLVVYLALPPFNSLIGTQLSLPVSSVSFWLAVVGFIILTSLLAGSYPAFYLSSFQPVGIFTKQFRKAQLGLSPRKGLVVLQFTFAIVLVIATIIVRDQIIFAQERDKGYANNQLIRVDFVGDIEKRYSPIKQELIRSGAAVAVTKTLTGLAHDGWRTWGLRWPGENPKDTNTAITLFSTDAHLVRTAGMKLIAGRDIDSQTYPSDSFAVVLNETAVKLMGFKKPIGQIITQPHDGLTWRVVGVVKDYIVGSPYEAIPPVVIQGPGAGFTTMHIKCNPAHSTAENLARVEEVFKKYNPAYPFDYHFVDQEYAAQFDNEQRTKTLAGLFAALAIFISCLGLFGLTSFTVEQARKEIGIRKVLGATVGQIVAFLSKDFLTLVGIALLIAIPITWYAMNQWLQDFTYRIGISWWVFATAGLLAVFIALLTVSFHTVKAALMNPVKSLRSE